MIITGYVLVGVALVALTPLLASLAYTRARTLRHLALQTQLLAKAESENRKLLLAVEQGPASIMITDLAGNIEYVNPAFVQSSGYAIAEVMGRNPRFLQSGQTPATSHAGLWQALAQGKTWRGEFSNRRKDGSIYNELATIAPIRQNDGRVSHYVAIKDDITLSKQMARELEQHRDNLERLVTERTIELEQAQQRAQAAADAKGAFLANMSHEIRTPLNAIIGQAHLLSSQGLAPKESDRLQKIDRSARHLLSIVNDVLDLSKIEAGKLHVTPTDFALADLVTVVRDLVATQAAEKGLQLQLDMAADLPSSLRGDGLRLSQVLLNFVTNAVKFTNSGTVTVRARQVAEDGSAIWLRFEVEDTGIGIPEAEHTRLFLPFEQIDASTTRQHGGTGLGLAISSRLVEMMGGRLGVASQVGLGSTFWFEVPLSRASASVSPVPQAPQALHALPRTSAAQVRVLVVEDDAFNQEVAVDLLRPYGFQVDVARNGAVAIELCARTAYALILMDIQMPVMDGLAATRALRQLPAYADIPIVAMTANTFAEDQAACNAAGMNDFVAKPIDPRTMLTTVCRWTSVELPGVLARPVAARQDTQELRAQLGTIGGLTAEDGLAVHQGDWRRYAGFLRRFCEERADTVTKLRAEIAAQQWLDARRTVHTLKGLAGTLGASRLQHAAMDVEVALLEPSVRRELAGRLTDLERELLQLVQALEARLPASEKAARPQAIDWSGAAQVTSELLALLAQDDTRAVELCREHNALLQSVLALSAPDFDAAVQAYDFACALVLLRAALASNPRIA